VDESEGWSAKLEDSVSGLAGAIWTPDSRQIIIYSDFGLRATVWDLCDGEAKCYFKSPKHLPPKGVSFTKNGKFMALCEKS
jgi:hypothetical protein